MLPWITALKVFNEGKPSWCMPRKGTADYLAVQRLRGAEPKKETKKEEPKKEEPKKDVKIGSKSKSVLWGQNLFGDDIFLYAVVTDVFESGNIEVEFYAEPEYPKNIGGIYALVKKDAKGSHWKAVRVYGEYHLYEEERKKIDALTFPPPGGVAKKMKTETKKEEPKKEEPKKEEPKMDAMSRAMNNPDLQNLVSSFTSRPKARALIAKAPKTLRILAKNGDLARIANGTAPVIKDGIRLLESGKPIRKVSGSGGISRFSIFAVPEKNMGDHQYLLEKYESDNAMARYGESPEMRKELKALNEALGITLGWFRVKTDAKTRIRLVKPEESFALAHIGGVRRHLFFFGYKGEVSAADKDLLREVDALVKE